MDRTEPALVPEWLRVTGNVSGGGSTIHRTDVTSPSRYSRSRSFSSNKDKDSPRYSDKSSSSNSRHSSSGNGPAKHPYSSFSRSHRDKNRDRAKEKSHLEDIWDHDSSDPLASILTSRVERSSLRRSRSLVSRKLAEKLPQKIEDSQVTRNGALSGGNNPPVIQKTVFEKDFPSLKTEEKQGVVGISRVLSPRLTSAVQSLPISNTGLLAIEKWTSALAEVPAIPANNGIRSPLQLSAATVPNSSSGVSTTGGLNMAEALSQPAARARVTQLPDKSQRLEELAIKQSRQLIPMTPSMPKPLVSSSVDKTKQQKIVAKTNETPMASRSIHPQPHLVHHANQSRVVPNRSDSGSTSHTGKFLVLKPGRETTALGAKDVTCSSGDSDGKVANGQLATPSTPTASTTVTTPMVSALENKTTVLSLSSKSTTDKKSFQSLAQSRSEFFNLMRRKNSSCATHIQIQSDSSSTISSPTAQTFEGGHDIINTRVVEHGNQIICNGNRHDIPEKIEVPDGGDFDISGNGSIYPDEEEAAFLRSLGWEENGGEDEGLTEEEINAFYQEYMNRRPSLEIRQSSQPKVLIPDKFPSAISEILSSDSSSSESESEA